MLGVNEDGRDDRQLLFLGEVEMMRKQMNRKPWSCRTIASVLMVCGLLVLSSGQALAQKKGGGGGSTNQGNVTVWYDAPSNTLFALGDTNGNKFLVEVRDDRASVIGAATSSTTINGVLNGEFSVPFDPEGFSVVIDGAAGDDEIRLNVATETTLFDALLAGGDGNDILNVHVNVPSDSIGAVIGNLSIQGGGGGDKINVAMLFNEMPLFVMGDLTVDGGDGNDEVTLYDRVFVAGGSILNGGAGRDSLKLAVELFAESLVTNFRTVTFW